MAYSTTFRSSVISLQTPQGFRETSLIEDLSSVRNQRRHYAGSVVSQASEEPDRRGVRVAQRPVTNPITDDTSPYGKSLLKRVEPPSFAAREPFCLGTDGVATPNKTVTQEMLQAALDPETQQTSAELPAAGRIGPLELLDRPPSASKRDPPNLRDHIAQEVWTYQNPLPSESMGQAQMRIAYDPHAKQVVDSQISAGTRLPERWLGERRAPVVPPCAQPTCNLEWQEPEGVTSPIIDARQRKQKEDAAAYLQTLTRNQGYSPRDGNRSVIGAVLSQPEAVGPFDAPPASPSRRILLTKDQPVGGRSAAYLNDPHTVDPRGLAPWSTETPEGIPKDTGSVYSGSASVYRGASPHRNQQVYDRRDSYRTDVAAVSAHGPEDVHPAQPEWPQHAAYDHDHGFGQAEFAHGGEAGYYRASEQGQGDSYARYQAEMLYYQQQQQQAPASDRDPYGYASSFRGEPRPQEPYAGASTSAPFGTDNAREAAPVSRPATASGSSSPTKSRFWFAGTDEAPKEPQRVWTGKRQYWEHLYPAPQEEFAPKSKPVAPAFKSSVSFGGPEPSVEHRARPSTAPALPATPAGVTSYPRLAVGKAHVSPPATARKHLDSQWTLG